MFGLNPDDYTNEEVEPIKTEKGWIINLKQSKDASKRICPHCKSIHSQVKDYHVVEYSISDNPGERNYVRIRKVRFICMNCRATYTNALKGIVENTNLTERTLQLI